MLAGFKAKGHPQQTRLQGSMRNIDDRALQPKDFAPLHARFHFTLDAAANYSNAKLPRFHGAAEDGLKQSWADERVYCNPPYSSIEPWVRKAWDETSCPLTVMLLPANRTEQNWWHKWVEPYRDHRTTALRTEFLPGRYRFLQPGDLSPRPNSRPPFGCVLLIWERV